ncbi:cytochrome P450 [Hypoxylon sp. FL1150]|nr:cytochrome P450 [Hypoxylon sp. FL1150]
MLLLETLGSATIYAAYAFVLVVRSCTQQLVWFFPSHHIYCSYPGPVLAKLTDVYAGVISAQRRLPLVIWELHEKYGSVARPAPNRLVFNTVTAFKSIYQNDDRITKSFTYEVLTRNKAYSVFNTLDRDLHRAKRKIVGHAFSERSVRSFEPALQPQVDVYLKQLLKSSHQPVNRTQRLGYLAIDIIAQLTLGCGLQTQTSEANRSFMQAMTLSFYVGKISHHFPAFRKVHTNRVFDHVFYETRVKFTCLLEEMVRSRLALDVHAKPDFFSVVAHALPGEAAKTRDSMVWKEAMVFLVAGGDTVATAMTAAFFLSVPSTFTSGRDIKSGPLLSSCRYLRACIDEALRMSPPVSATLWQQQVATDKEPLAIDGHFMSPGHHPTVFPDPFTFKPERWLPSDSTDPKTVASDEATRKQAVEAFASFSIGPRNCVGKPLAYLKTSAVLAKTLWDRGRPEEFCTLDGFNSTHDGPYLVFRERESVSLEKDLN